MMMKKLEMKEMRKDREAQVEAHEKKKKKKKLPKMFAGKSTKLGFGGRAAILKSQGVPNGVIGAIARRKGAAPGGPNYHG
jgi:hypothetical protein